MSEIIYGYPKSQCCLETSKNSSEETKKDQQQITNDEKKIHIKQERRNEALAEILVAIESKKIEAIRQKLKVQEDLDELDELADLETKLFGLIVA